MALADLSDDEFDDDEPLAVISAESDDVVADEPKRRRRRLRNRRPPTNTNVEDVGPARERTIRDATGESRRESDEWRDDMEEARGDPKGTGRAQVIAALTRTRHTHNSDSGFGLA